MSKIRLLFLLLILFVAHQQFTNTQLANGQIPIAGETIPKYVTPLPHFVGARVDASGGALTISAKEITEQILPAPNPALGIVGYPQTKCWGYEVSNGKVTAPAHYPAFTIEAKRGVPVTVTYHNLLGNATLYTPVSTTLPGIIPVDQTLHWADPLGTGHVMTTYNGPVPLVPHLHGGEVQSTSDGGPDAWWTPENHPNYPQINGPSWAMGASNIYRYPNTQEAATIWFHDHALGVTRLNVYAGLAGFYFLRDNLDNGKKFNLLGLPAGPQEIEFAIQDKMFDTLGQLYFPNLGINLMDHPFWNPEFFGDVIVVNGATWPYLDVEPRRYRFHFLDGSNARFYEMFLETADTHLPGPVFWQIGTDGGLLNRPVKIDPNDPTNPGKLLLGPGERADIIIDFSKFAGKTLLLRNVAAAPYPDGDSPDPLTTGQIAQFRVKSGKVLDLTVNPAWGLPLRIPLVKLVNFATGTPAVTPDINRQLTLNEIMGEMGPSEMLINNSKWDAPVTENPTEGNTEIWKIINLTVDAHPMHLHLTQYQLVSRQAFDVAGYLAAYEASFSGGVSSVDNVDYAPGVFIPGYGPPFPYGTAGVDPFLGGNPDVTPYLVGSPRVAAQNEHGWKDTFIMYPGEVTTVIVRFAPTDKPIKTPKANLLFGFDPSVGPGYVWHCHIVDHEDNEMMRPYAVNPNPSRALPKASPTVASEANVPKEFGLSANYPNPFNPSTEIRFQLPEDSYVTLEVFNSLGQKVAALLDEQYSAGYYSVTWDAKHRPSGAYYYRLQAGNYTASKMMMLVK